MTKRTSSMRAVPRAPQEGQPVRRASHRPVPGAAERGHQRTGVDPREVDDVVVGCVSETGEQGTNLARGAVLAAGWPIEVPGVTLNRFCGSANRR